MSSTRENLIYRVFKDYCRFFYYENQVALLEGRNYETIYAFYDTLSTLRAKESNLNDWMAKVNVLTEIVTSFIGCSKITYPFLLSDDENCCNFDKKDITYEKVVDFFNTTSSYMFEEYYISYSLVSNYKESEIIEELLIEFNNYMSHFVKYITNQDVSSGISHLYRAYLDGYKDIILENIIILLSDIKMRDEFISLRVKECSKIGIKEQDKVEILNIYKEIAENIITVCRCDENKV